MTSPMTFNDMIYFTYLYESQPSLTDLEKRAMKELLELMGDYEKYNLEQD